jgi:SAM-dependent methyltransferase
MNQLVMEYEAAFGHRGGSYAAAMGRCPDARRSEFEALFRNVSLPALRRVADIPSGGGYLDSCLPSGVKLDAYDPACAFRDGRAVYPVDLARPRLMRGDYDLIVSLAGIHHLEDKAGFFAALADHVGSGGQIVLADVASTSRVAGFLDEFVGRHNETGHRGLYLSGDDPFDFGAGHPRIARVVVETLPTTWLFRDAGEMDAFCCLLFGAAGASAAMMDQAIRSHIGVDERDGGCRMLWEITTITATLS